GDMLTPAFSLIVPDLLHPVAFGKYIVAYFDDVSAEEDVPPPFNITIKYKLMKHFEELYFRILDMEKHEPGRVNRVEGIAEDEYFNCASGRALRDAIEAFQAHQLEYPDWFERECVDSEEEALESDLQCPLLADVNSISIQQCVPLCREEPPIFSNTINAIEGGREVLSLTPLIKDAEEDVFTQQVLPVTPLEENQVCAVLPVAHKERGPVYAALPAAHLECSRTYAVYTEALWKGRQRHLLNPGVEVYSLGTREDGIQHSVSVGSTANAVQVSVPGDTKPQGGLDSVGSAAEEREEELEFPGCLSADTLESLLALQQALVARNPLPCSPAEHELHDPQATGSVGQEPFPWRRPSSGSDQGYFSRVSPQQDSSLKEEVPEPESGGTTGPLHPTSYAAALCRSKKITP
ncbi:interleukin-17 receptor A-like, partial [Arapaima gigas]